MLLEEQFYYLQPRTTEHFRRIDAARYREQERDVERGFRLREDVERERIEKARDQAEIDIVRRQAIEGDHAFGRLVEVAVCRYCEGLTDAIVWSTRIEARACGCPSPSDDEGAPPSPPQTPPHPTDVLDGIVNRRQWLKERLLMEVRGPYRPEFEDYTCWRDAKTRFSQALKKPTMNVIRPKRSIKTLTDRHESISNQIRGQKR